MKIEIEIEYNGAYAECRISGYEEEVNGDVKKLDKVPFNECSAMTKIIVLSAFDCITEDYTRRKTEEYLKSKNI